METPMHRRVIRMRNQNKGNVSLEIDSITDPTLLAVSLMGQFSQVEISSSDMLRASAIEDTCTRAIVLSQVYKKKKKKYIDTSSMLTFDIGNSVHRMLQNDPKYFGNTIVGWWECLSCGGVSDFGKKPPRCQRCGGSNRALLYKEHSFRIKNILMGHPDGFFEVAPGICRIVDFKSIAVAGFLDLKGPDIKHVYQIISYALMSQVDKSLPIKIDTSVSYVIYLAKQSLGKGKYPIAVHIVRLVPEIVSDIRKRCSEVSNAFDRDGMIVKLPSQLEECVRANFSSSRPKWCVTREECMNLQ